jgi:hypothetical protein
MTKGEIFWNDSCLIGPIMLLLDQYLNSIIPEHYVLWIFLVNNPPPPLLLLILLLIKNNYYLDL